MHQEIMRRGIDFLVEIELGNAPPLEYVIKNISQNRAQQNKDQVKHGKLNGYYNIVIYSGTDEA